MSASRSCKNSACSYAVELARSVGAASEGETREAFDVVAGPSLDHRDDVEQLMGHQAVAYVTKILNTNEATLTEPGKGESLKEYFHTQRESGAGAIGARQHREQRARRQR